MGPESIRKIADAQGAVRSANREALAIEVELLGSIDLRAQKLRTQALEQKLTICEQDIARQRV